MQMLNKLMRLVACLVIVGATFDVTSITVSPEYVLSRVIHRIQSEIIILETLTGICLASLVTTCNVLVCIVATCDVLVCIAATCDVQVSIVTTCDVLWQHVVTCGNM
jgi:hypothetical protein